MFTKRILAQAVATLFGLGFSLTGLAADADVQAEPLLKGSKKSGTGNVSIEEVMVTGSYTTRSMNGATGLEMSLRETPQTVTIMTSQMIEDKALVDMEQVLVLAKWAMPLSTAWYSCAVSSWIPACKWMA